MIRYLRTEKVGLHEVVVVAHTDSGYIIRIPMDRAAIGDFLRTIGGDPCKDMYATRA